MIGKAAWIFLGFSSGVQQSTTKRRSSVKSGSTSHAHHELFQKRRTSVPGSTISYISTENVSTEDSFDRPYVVGECIHKRALTSGTGYRCEKHGGGRGAHGHIFNGSSEAPGFTKRHRNRNDPYNASSPNVSAVSSDHGMNDKYFSNIFFFFQDIFSHKKFA